MNEIVGQTLPLTVIGTDLDCGREVYRVLFQDTEYHVRKYPGQSYDKKTVLCTCTGTTFQGDFLFEQSFSEVLGDLYVVGKEYPFKLSGEGADVYTWSHYYHLTDVYGLQHRVYMRHDSSFREGELVRAKVLAISQGALMLEVISDKPTRNREKKVVVQESRKPIVLDFSKLNPTNDTTLRDYQIENKKKIYEAWQRCRSVMLQMPTGTGKTRLFVSIARDIFDYGIQIGHKFKVLFLAHRRELIEQISDHLGDKYLLPHGLIMAQNIEQRQYSNQVGSVPTLVNRLDSWESIKFDVIIIDEAHHVKAKSYKKIIDLFPEAKILGVTATPYRLNHAGFRPEFDELIVSPSVAEFIKRKYLCEYDYYSIKPDSALQEEINRMKLDFEGDYLDSEMLRVMDRDRIRAKILDTYLKFAGNKKAIVYTINRAHNIHLASQFISAGIPAAYIDSETRESVRKETVERFRRGDIQVLFNVNIFSEGFDCPDVEVIQLARPTTSLSMYLQQVGRGLRPAEGKDRLIILDNVGLFNKFGFPSANRKWRYHFEGQEVDESFDFYKSENEEERVVKDILEGEEEVSMLHSSVGESVSLSAFDNISINYKESFIAYANKKLDKYLVQRYVELIENTLDDFIKKYIDVDFKGIFQTVNIIYLLAIQGQLSALHPFELLDHRKHNNVSAALKEYIAFARWYNTQGIAAPAVRDEQLEDNSPETINKAPVFDEPNEHIIESKSSPQCDDNYKERFEDYLLSIGLAQRSVKQYVSSIENDVDPLIRDHFEHKYTSLYSIIDLSEVRRLSDLLDKDESFITLNRVRNKIPGMALRKYVAFVKDYDTEKTESKVHEPDSGAITIEEIDSKLEELNNLSDLLKKNGLPEMPELFNKIEEYNKLKASFHLVPGILLPIENYLEEYKLSAVVTFKYRGAIRDVDILEPTFGPNINNEDGDIDEILSLIKKNQLPIPQDILDRSKTVSESKELRKTIRSFENWLVGYISYLKPGTPEIDTIYYSPQNDFVITFVGFESTPLSYSSKHVSKKAKGEMEGTSGSRQKDGIIGPNRSMQDKISLGVIQAQDEIRRQIKENGGYYTRSGKWRTNLGREKGADMTKQHKAAHAAIQREADEWRKNSVGYQWVINQLKAGVPRKEIIEEFNKRHETNPADYSTRDGKRLSKGVLSKWASRLEEETDN